MKPLREQGSASHALRLQRLGVVMEPEPGNAMEVEGVLNPASALGRDGHLYLFPGSWRGAITRELVSRAYVSTRLGDPSAWRGWTCRHTCSLR